MVDEKIKLAILHGPDAPKPVLIEDLRKVYVNGLDVRLDTPAVFQAASTLGELTRKALHGHLCIAANRLAEAGWTVLWEPAERNDFEDLEFL